MKYEEVLRKMVEDPAKMARCFMDLSAKVDLIEETNLYQSRLLQGIHSNPLFQEKCDCVPCVCENSEQCQGCGAKYCNECKEKQ